MKTPVAAFGFFVRSPCRLLLAGSIVAVANVYGAVTNTPAIPSFDVRFANTNLIRIYDDDTADPYPSSIFVSGMTSLVNGVTVTLEGLTHSFPSDIEVLLVGPTGEAVLLMSDAGGGASISNVRLKFDQAASDSLPFNQTIVSGSYQPSDYEEQLPDFFPPPAPAQLYQESLSIFDGTNPNGLWQLYIVDSVDEDSGLIAGGWSLDFGPDSQVPPLDPAALNNWQVRFSSSPNFIRRVLSSPKGYVAVGVGGTILTSAEGAVWTPRSSGTNVELSGVAFGGGTFVVVGFGGTILTSTDGITWTRRPSPTNAELYCVASSGNGQFVAAGTGGFVLLSSDSGATWQVANSGTNQVFLGLTFGQGKFVLTGAAGAIRVSTNGTDWIAASVSGLGGMTARDIWNAVYGSGLFVAVTAGGAILTSRDGLSWTNQMVPAVNNRPLVGVTYANDTFVCGGFNGALFSSVDGVNWTPHRFPGNPVDFLWAFASDGQTLVAADNGNSNLLMQSDTFYLSPPRIVIQPRDTVVRIGGNTNLNVGVMGTSPFNYHWRQGETLLPQATNQTLVFSNVPASADGVYGVTVGNPVGTNMSQTASLQVGLPPAIVLQPLDQEATPGATVTFSVEMSGTPPFNYGWRRPPSVYTTFEGQGRQSFWTVTNAGAAQVGVYGVVITNEYGSIISRPAQLTMAADVDGDGLPDTWELEQALNPGDPSDANRDADGDGLTNLQEYDSGTSPTNSASVLRLQSTLTGGALSLTFEAAPGKTYTILRRETIDAGVWLRWLDFAARTNARIETVIDPVVPTSRFYRVVTPRQP